MGKKNRHVRPEPAKSGSKVKASDVQPERSPQQERPLFSLEFLAGEYCLTKCDQEHRAAFATRLHMLAQKPWAEIAVMPRKGIGYEKIPQREIRAPIPPHVTEDVNLLAFRYHGNAPMVGYRDGRTFFVLWLDRDFSLYDHE